MRSFIAVAVTESVKLAAHKEFAWIRQSFKGARCAKLEQMHLTLAFLGDVAESKVETIKTAVARCAAGEKRFQATFGGRGAFPSAKRSDVIWMGVEDGGRLIALEAALRKELKIAGVELRDRTYQPHLTLARLDKPSDASKWVGQAPQNAIEMEVNELTLFESRLGESGARHIPVASFPFFL